MSWVPKPDTNVGPSYPEKPKGWFSRRYPTNEQHAAAVAGRSRAESRARKRVEAEAREAALDVDSPRRRRNRVSAVA